MKTDRFSRTEADMEDAIAAAIAFQEHQDAIRHLLEEDGLTDEEIDAYFEVEGKGHNHKPELQSPPLP